MAAEQAGPVPGPSGTEGHGPRLGENHRKFLNFKAAFHLQLDKANQELMKDSQAEMPPRKRELHPIGIEKERTIHLEPSHQEVMKKKAREDQLQNFQKMEDSEANEKQLMELEKESAEGWNKKMLEEQEKQAADHDFILKAFAAQLSPDCEHPSFPVMLAARDNGDFVPITSIKEFNKVREEECEKEPLEKRRRMVEWGREIDPVVEEDDDSDESDDEIEDALDRLLGVQEDDGDDGDDDNDEGNLLEEMNAPPPRRGRFLEAMMRDIIRDDEAHPDRFRGEAPEGVPNIMQRLANLQERQNRQREIWRREREEGPAAALEAHFFRLARRDQ